MTREEGQTWGDYDIDVWFCVPAEDLDASAGAVIQSLIDLNMGTVWLFDPESDARYSLASGREWSLNSRRGQENGQIACREEPRLGALLFLEVRPGPEALRWHVGHPAALRPRLL